MTFLSATQLPKGFRFAAATCGLKKSGLDVGLLVSETPAVAACIFTTNVVKAAPVALCREHLRRSGSQIRAVIVNSGNANCATGPAGLAASQETAKAVARSLDCPVEQVLVCSTGVIGVPLRAGRIIHAVPGLSEGRAGDARAFEQFARAMMTTDTHPKWAAAACVIGGKKVRLLGCAKGAGMIHPRMATMLGFIATDAKASSSMLRRALRQAADSTFNAITVDGDTSTNDTLAILANGASSAPRIENAANFRKFVVALESVCHSLALQIVADGEGAKRVIEIQVCGASSDRAADQVARTVANSPLVKTALAGGDPNWGRILAAAGRGGVRFDPDRAEIRMAGILMCRNGRECRFDERAAHHRLLGKTVTVVLDLHLGNGRARIWTCDFTGDYVRINASYRT